MIYDNPEVYELAFSFRDVDAETEFMDRVIRTFSGRPVHSVLEIASGPAPHAGALVERGYAYVGLDNNPKMIAYAETKWRSLDRPPIFVRADMKSFALPTPVDFAYVLLGSLYLNSTADLCSHFDSIANSLLKGGLYFLDLCIEFANPLNSVNSHNAISHRDDLHIDSTFDIRLLDASKNLYEERWQLTVETPEKTQSFETVEQNVALFADDFRVFIASRPDFELVGWWSDWDLHEHISPGCELRRPFALVRRK